MVRLLVCGRMGPFWMWKALLIFVSIGVAGQLLGAIFNKSTVQPSDRSIFMAPDAQGPSLGSCQPHTHVMFLKTHKTASSTMLNILYRFGEERNLHFALPVGYQLGYPLPFNAHRVKGYQGPRVVEFHIMCNHMRFNKVEVEKVMPADTFYFSIIREPVSLAESSFAYFKEVSAAFRKSKSLADFVEDPWKYYDPHVRHNHYAHNGMWFDFGLDNNANFSEPLAQQAVAMIRQTFRLILLSEYFDESMILLRHMLCWPLDAVVSFSLNARQQKPSSGSSSWMSAAAAVAGVTGSGGSSKAKSPGNLTEQQREKLRQWHAYDVHLYNAFNKTFWEEVNRFGHAKMEQEVQHLRTQREHLASACLRDGGRPVEAQQIQDKSLRPYQSGSVKIVGYELQPRLDNVTRATCLRMIMPEIQYKDVLDAKQFPRAKTGQQIQGLVVVAGGSSRTGERSVGGEARKRREEQGERDSNGSPLMRKNQTLIGGQRKGKGRGR